jgi:hypothetical protein
VKICLIENARLERGGLQDILQTSTPTPQKLRDFFKTQYNLDNYSDESWVSGISAPENFCGKPTHCWV